MSTCKQEIQTGGIQDMKFDEISGSISKIGVKMKESASRSVENVKADNQIRELQAEIDDAFRLMGALLYQYRKGLGENEPDYGELIGKIDENNEKINSLKQSKMERAGRFCSKCGEKVDDAALFCPHCGEKL